MIMESTAKTNFVRIAPRKMRLVANEVRGYGFNDSVEVLKNMKKKAADIILKTVRSAGANAKIISPDLNETDLYIQKIYVDEGIALKRFRPRARGRGARLKKRTSKLTVVLSDE